MTYGGADYQICTGTYTFDSENYPVVEADTPITGTVDSEGKITFPTASWGVRAANSYHDCYGYNGDGYFTPVTTAIEGIAADDTDAPAEYYTISGIRVNNTDLAPGLYIRRAGSKVSKILVK